MAAQMLVHLRQVLLGFVVGRRLKQVFYLLCERHHAPKRMRNGARCRDKSPDQRCRFEGAPCLSVLRKTLEG